MTLSIFWRDVTNCGNITTENISEIVKIFNKVCELPEPGTIAKPATKTSRMRLSSRNANAKTVRSLALL